MSQSSRSTWNRILGLLVGILVVALVLIAMNAVFRSWWSGEQKELAEQAEPYDAAAERKAREKSRVQAPAMADEESAADLSLAPPPPMEAPEPRSPSGWLPKGSPLRDSGRYTPGSRDNRERYPQAEDNPVKLVKEHPVSTFSLDVDTASYSLMRRYLEDGTLPPRGAIRVEELINYFDYDYPLPEDRSAPFKPTVHITPAPWDEKRRLLHIGIKGFDIEPGELPAANLVFLIDVSGSMDDDRKLPLVKQTLRMLTDQMGKSDTVGIVVYAGSAGTVLEPTSDKAEVVAALDRLKAGGSTAGGEGIRQAYALAERGYDPQKVNRVVLATDGDFNVGITDPDRLEDFIAEKRKTGIFLTVLTYGTGNLNDRLTQKLAQAGNGNAAYIDKGAEARKVVVEEMRSTIFPIAKDVKVQIEFNPAHVSAYRLIGYETRLLKREDFDNDAVDAGDIGSGHTVTALYELYPAGDAPMAPLRYGSDDTQSEENAPGKSAETAFLRMRYKLPDEDKSRLIERPVVPADVIAPLDAAPADMRFAIAVAAFGQRLRGSKYLGTFSVDKILTLAEGAVGKDPYGYRAEFVQLMRRSKDAEAFPELARPIDGPPMPIIRVPPPYPACAESKNGEVVVEFVVEPDGSLSDIKVVKATSDCFAEAARAAMQRWRYRPKVSEGEAVRSDPMRVTIQFIAEVEEESDSGTSEVEDSSSSSSVELKDDAPAVEPPDN